VDVHVPEARDQKLASALDNRGFFGDRYFAANRRHAPVAYEHGYVRPRCRAGGVDHGIVTAKGIVDLKRYLGNQYPDYLWRGR